MNRIHPVSSKGQTKNLIESAVYNSTSKGFKDLADQLFAWWFNRLVYAQIWEDPQVDLEALRLPPDANILTISSGGCNALAYLSANPASVHAVDLNANHLAMLEIKKAAIAHLPSYADVLAFLGDANRKENGLSFENHIAPNLDLSSKKYWERKDLMGRPRYSLFSRHAYRHGLLGQFIAGSHPIVRLLGGNMQKMIQAQSPEEQKQLFEKHIAPVFNHWLIRFLANQPAVLYSLGIPPAQFEALKRDAQGSLPDEFRERMRRLACAWPIQENCFAQQAFQRRYDTSKQSALPMYLQQEHYPSIKKNLDRLHTHHQTLTQFLENRPDQSLHGFLFLDAQDWMDVNQLTALWKQVSRTATPGARVVFRTGGKCSPLEAMLPLEILKLWQTNPVENEALLLKDRSAIYGGVHVYERL
jgi:S-adenosylmethionine-diacylglycerol 3-amino-3-carboxypropyl transferase